MNIQMTIEAVAMALGFYAIGLLLDIRSLLKRMAERNSN